MIDENDGDWDILFPASDSISDFGSFDSHLDSLFLSSSGEDLNNGSDESSGFQQKMNAKRKFGAEVDTWRKLFGKHHVF